MLNFILYGILGTLFILLLDLLFSLVASILCLIYLVLKDIVDKIKGGS